MYRRILVPVDGSRASETALDHALALARPFNAEILLLRVIEDPTVERRDQVESYLESLATRLGRDGCSVTTAVKEGSVARAVREFAHEAGASLIVMSSHGRKSAHARVLSDTIAMELLNESHLPILIVKPSEYRVRSRLASE
jgi:nucleotide-binding universal stress UspA family protein